MHNNIALLRIEPLKVWLLGSEVPILEPEEAVILDLSHSRSTSANIRDLKLPNC